MPVPRNTPRTELRFKSYGRPKLLTRRKEKNLREKKGRTGCRPRETGRPACCAAGSWPAGLGWFVLGRNDRCGKEKKDTHGSIDPALTPSSLPVPAHGEDSGGGRTPAAGRPGRTPATGPRTACPLCLAAATPRLPGRARGAGRQRRWTSGGRAASSMGEAGLAADRRDGWATGR